MKSADRPVFDVANQNVPTEFEIDTDVPSEKTAARAELDRLMKTAPAITYCRYRPPNRPAKWKPGKYAAANDNVEPLPIVESLRRDGRASDITWVMRYRMLADVVGATAFDDEIDMSAEGMGVEVRSLNPGGAAFKKSFAKMTDTDLPGGEISYREQRHTVKQRVSVGQRTNAADDDGGQSQAPLRLAKSEDERIARIDGKPMLAALRVGIGDLTGPFDAAALAGETLTEIGDGMGRRWKARSADAKIAVYTAIDRLRDQWRLIERQMAAQAAACERRVKQRRAELAAIEADYLRQAA